MAGSDSGGGAGIQADLRAFAALDVFGTTALAALTAQNPHGVRDVHPVPPEHLRQQILAVLEAFDVRAAKTGMLFSAAHITVVADAWREHRTIPLVVDPVMVATSGARLLRDDAVGALQERLLPLAMLVTPNLPEAEILCGTALGTSAAVVAAAKALAQRFGCSVLIKGGHDTMDPGSDVLSDGTAVWRFRAPPVADPATTHGTGCALSAAITAALARGADLHQAIGTGKAYVLGLLRHCVRVGPGVHAMWPTAELPVGEITVESVVG